MKLLGLLFGVLSLGCLMISATQAEPMVPPRTTAIHLHNKTEHTLRLVKQSMVHGDWTPKLQPPAEIKPGATGYWKSESGGVANSTGPQGNVRYTLGTPAWHTPFNVSPGNEARAGTQLTSISRNPDQIDVFYIAPDGGIHSVWWNTKEGKWSVPYTVAPVGAARKDSSLTGICRGAGHMDIYWITPKGEIATRGFQNNKWDTAYNISGANAARAGTDLAVVSRFTSSLEVYFIGSDSSVHVASWFDGNWHKPASISPANSVRSSSSLAATTRTKDEMHVFYVNRDDGISTVWWRQGKWGGPGQVSGKGTVAANSNLHTLSLDTKHCAVFWVNRDNAVATSWVVKGVDADKWHGPDIIAPAKSARPNSVVAMARTSKHIDVFWLSPDGAVWTTYFNSGSPWNKPFTVSTPGAARGDSGLTAAARLSYNADVFWIDGKNGVMTNWWNEKSVDEVYISWTNPFVDSQYGNTYHEQAPPAYSLSYTGGTGSHAEVNYVLEKSKPHMVSGFKPSTHGFDFSNNYWKDKGIKLPVVFLDFPKPFGKVDITNSSQGLCGGMVFTVMDYFYAKEKIPKFSPPPSSETDEMFQYLRQRLMTSWDVTGNGPKYIKFMRHDYPDADEGVVQGLGLMKGRSYVIAREEWPKVKADIDANRLSPIALVQIESYNPGDIGKNHQVLVYGYQLSGNNVTLHYYDPNFPKNDTVELRFTIGNLSKRIDLLRYVNGKYNAKTINTFFRTSYSPPPASLKRPKSP